MKQALQDLIAFHQVLGTTGPSQPTGLQPAPGIERDRFIMMSGMLKGASESLKREGCTIAGRRGRLMMEELHEVLVAMLVTDPVRLADGLADLIFAAVGTAVEAGIPLDEIWEKVCASNMAKFVPCTAGCRPVCGVYMQDVTYLQLEHVTDRICETCRGTGKVVLRDESGKVKKPEGWTPPTTDIEAILRAYGWPGPGDGEGEVPVEG